MTFEVGEELGTREWYKILSYNGRIHNHRPPQILEREPAWPHQILELGYAPSQS